MTYLLPKKYLLGCLLGILTCSLHAQVRISEFMAINGQMLLDEDLDYSDWIEIENTSESTVDLGGWYLTDDSADLTK